MEATNNKKYENVLKALDVGKPEDNQCETEPKQIEGDEANKESTVKQKTNESQMETVETEELRTLKGTEESQALCENDTKEIPENCNKPSDQVETEKDHPNAANDEKTKDDSVRLVDKESPLEVEDIDIHEQHTEELILPDEGDGTQGGVEPKEANTGNKKISPIEREVIPIAGIGAAVSRTVVSQRRIKVKKTYDPLNFSGEDCEENMNKKTKGPVDSDGDDVEIIEQSNSPICIESDDDETTAGQQQEATTTNRAPTTMVRSFARKSTARPSSSSSTPVLPTVRSSKGGNSASTSLERKVIDTIVLVDSSDEERNGNPLRKRTLLTKRKGKTHYAKVDSMKKKYFPQKPSGTTASPQPRQAPTPQSNFLNAVNLQPAQTPPPNPPNPSSFSAQLLDKNVVIPKAFSGNSENVMHDREATKDANSGKEATLEQRYVRWLEHFLAQFTNPQQIASHSCFVLLQRALKYKDFSRIKNLRTNLNTRSQSATEQMNQQLMLHMRQIFYKNAKQLSAEGRRFCEMTCTNMLGKAVTLMTDARTGQVTSETHTEVGTPTSRPNSTKIMSPAAVHCSALSARKRGDDDLEYIPCKPVPLAAADAGVSDSERKRSLRTKRTRRYDQSFSYNEDLADMDLEDTDEDEEKAKADAAVQRKIEEKRLEAKRQREQQVKSFENAFIETFAKNIDSYAKHQGGHKLVRLKDADTTMRYSADNDAEDLLQATWIEQVENDASTTNDRNYEYGDEPKEHRIYKVMPAPHKNKTKLTVDSKHKNKRGRPPKPKRSVEIDQEPQPEVITCDDYPDVSGGPCEDASNSKIAPINSPKNIDQSLHVLNKDSGLCVICKRRVSRIVHHYVNEHRGCEVYISRLTQGQVQRLLCDRDNRSKVRLYKNGQLQYEAQCTFCQRQCRFMLPYWYQHFAMHTGEYAYRCSGCGIRKPTRSLITTHTNLPCAKRGHVCQDYTYDPKASQIEARICTLCNYVQLHRSNVIRHLYIQHDVQQVLPKHIQNIVLLKTPALRSRTTSCHGVALAKANLSPPSELRTKIVDHQQQQQSAVAAAAANTFWNECDASDDLSYIICGMLDVQMNTSD